VTQVRGYVDTIVSATRTRLDAPAYVFNASGPTWREMLESTARLAGGLRALGVGAGDRVAILARNGSAYLELYLAIPWAGAIAAHLNWRWTVAENIQAIQDCSPVVLVVDDKVAPDEVTAIQAAMPSLKIVATGSKLDRGAIPFSHLSESAPIPDAGRAGDDPLAIYFTGGTTGRSKGVVLSHHTVIRNSLSVREVGMMPDGASMLVIPPLFHLGAGSSVTTTMLAGGTVVLDREFDPERTLQWIERGLVTDAFLVPTMIGMLLDHPGFIPERLTRLRRIVYGSSPISSETLDRILNYAPHIDFFQAYGMTESCSVATVLRPEFHLGEHRQAGRYRSAGLPVRGVTLRIVDAEGRDLPAGTVGEVLIGGEMLMLGYWNQPETTAAALRDGWLRTGDGGYLDEHGLLYIVDRLKDMIVTGGENVYSGEVENALSRHPAVAQCAVIGVPDDRWGERVHAVVFVRPGQLVSDADLIAHCRARIGAFKCPRSIEFSPGPIPMSAAGKILKHELRMKHWQGRERRVS